VDRAGGTLPEQEYKEVHAKASCVMHSMVI